MARRRLCWPRQVGLGRKQHRGGRHRTCRRDTGDRLRRRPAHVAGQRRRLVAGRRRQHRLRRPAASPRPARRASRPGVPARSPRTTSSPTTSPPGTAWRRSATSSTPRASSSARRPTAPGSTSVVTSPPSTGSRATTSPRSTPRPAPSTTRSSPRVGAQVAGIAVNSPPSTSGGNFMAAGGQSRTRLAAFSSANGALLPWAPTADAFKVSAMVLSPDGSKVVVGGGFTSLNGVPASGLGAVDSTTGATQPFPMNQVVTDGGNKCGITNLTVDNNQIYGGGFAFGVRQLRGHLRRGRQHRRRELGQRLPRRHLRHLPDRAGPLQRQPRAQLLLHRRLPEQQPDVEHQHAPRVGLHDLPDRHERGGRRLRVGLHQRPRLLAAAVVPDGGHRWLHRSEPGRLVAVRQQQLPRDGWRVPLRERHRAAGSGAVRRQDGRAQQAWSRQGPQRPGAGGPVVHRRPGPRVVAVGVRHGQQDADLQRLPLRSTAPSTRRPRTRRTGPTR